MLNKVCNKSSFKLSTPVSWVHERKYTIYTKCYVYHNRFVYNINITIWMYPLQNLKKASDTRFLTKLLYLYIDHTSANKHIKLPTVISLRDVMML